MNLKKIAEDLARIEREVGEAYYRNWAGFTSDLPISQILGKYKHFVSQKAIDDLRRYTPQNPEEKRSHAILLWASCAFNMESEAHALTEKLVKSEASTPVELEGRKVPFRYASVLLTKESSRARRLAIAQAQDKVRDEVLNPIRLQIANIYAARPARFGFKSYRELCETVQMRNLRSFSTDMMNFLASTAGLYEAHLKYYMEREAGITLGQATNSDLLYLRSARKFDNLFPKEKLLPVVKATLAGIGFDLDKMTNIKMDAEERETKTPRPFVSAISPPEDVRLVIRPIGGQNDYVNFLHEAGHAVHFASMDKALPTEFKYWGDRGTTEGLAYLFQNLVLNPQWLARFIGRDHLEDFLKFSVFQRLMGARRLAASFLYELRVFDEKRPAGLSEEYARIMSDVMKVRYSREGYLEVDAEFYSAGYMRAIMFESQLRRTLVWKHGDEWWTKKETGEMLREFYRHGRKQRPEEILKPLGYKELDMQFFLEHLSEVLGPVGGVGD